MKIKYRPEKDRPWVEFDPGTGLCCPFCGHIEPIPFGLEPHGIVICQSPNEKRWRGVCGTAMFDINSFVGEMIDGIYEYARMRIDLGQMEEENLKEWHRKKVEWLMHYSVGTVPKWKVEPWPIRLRVLSK